MDSKEQGHRSCPGPILAGYVTPSDAVSPLDKCQGAVEA